MSRISAQDFVGTRARFQRLHDAKLFTGWIVDFMSNRVTISTNTNYAMQIGEEFRFEGFGNQISVVFNAKLETIGQLDLASEGIVKEVEGTNARLIEAKRVKLELQVSSPVRFSASKENLRMRAQNVYTSLVFPGSKVDGFTIDVARQGIGFVCDKQIKAKQTVQVRIETKLGPIEAEGNVRYCVPDKDREGMMRVGVMFTDMDRVNKPRWERFLAEVA